MLKFGSGCHGNKNPFNSMKTEVRVARWGKVWESMSKETFSSFHFCLVMENHKLEGYITEKIMNAFVGGCIP